MQLQSCRLFSLGEVVFFGHAFNIKVSEPTTHRHLHPCPHAVYFGCRRVLVPSPCTLLWLPFSLPPFSLPPFPPFPPTSLFPYIYTENHATRTSGIALVHPVYYADRAAALDKAYDKTTSYLFGSAMLVAPIVSPIPANRSNLTQKTWLPPGRWVDFAGSKVYSCSDGAGCDVTATYALHELPIFVREGSVVPLRTAASLGQTVAFSDPLVWSVWPGHGAAAATHGGATVVEDDGATLRFETELATATTNMSWTVVGNDEDATDPPGFTLTVTPTAGSFDVNGGCTDVEAGIEYGGPGADLQELPGDVETAAECCDACGTFSNCGFWTWLDTKRCSLKVSRSGKVANASAVSGAAPRRMPAKRSHGFQLRGAANSAVLGTVAAVTVNGTPLPALDPDDDGKVGWYTVAADAPTWLARPPPGSLVILTPSFELSQTLVVRVGGVTGGEV